MKNIGKALTRFWSAVGLFLFLSAVLIAVADEPKGPEFKSAVYLGGSGDQGAAQTGMGLAAANGELCLSGTDFLAGKSLLYCFSDPSGSSPLWTIRWPSGKSVGMNEESFPGVVVTHEGIYCAGRSWAETSDTAGSKEQKAVLVKFPLSGATGPGPGGSLWVAKPAFFPYGGIETLIGVAATGEGVSTALYAVGRGQYNGSDNTAVAVKFDSAGNILWTKVLGKMEWNAWSQGDSVVVHNGSIYVAGYAHWQGLKSWLGFKNPIRPHAGLWKLDPNGNVLWSRESSQPILQDSRPGISLAAQGRFLYVACTRAIGSDGVFTHDLLVLKYDENGDLIWSKEWGSVKDEVATGIAVKGDRLYAVGYTNGWVGGGNDLFLAEMDADSGDILSVDYRGGAQEDMPHNVVVSGESLYVVGESKSASEGAHRDVMLLRYALTAPVPALNVSIDIHPGSFPNPVNLKSKGKIPVAILSTPAFKAAEVVDRASLTFGHSGDEKSLAPSGCKAEDADGDGLLDLVCHFETQRCGFLAADKKGHLKGKTLEGRPVFGSDSIGVVPHPKDGEGGRKDENLRRSKPDPVKPAPPKSEPKPIAPDPVKPEQEGAVVY